MRHRCTAHGEIQFAAHGKDAVAHCLRIQPRPVHAPEQAVVGINRRGGRTGGGGLPVGGAGDDEFVQGLDRSFGFIAEPDRQPVEQFRM